MHIALLLTSVFTTGLAVASPSANNIALGPFVDIVDLSTATRPTVEQAAVQARKLVLSQTISTLSTVFPVGERHGLEGQPIGLMGYYADCSEDGNPTLLGMNIVTSFRNAAADNATISLSVRQHMPHMFSPVAHPRLSLMGKLTTIPSDTPEAARLKKCFTFRHPDAKLWTPGNKIHESYWVRLEVERIYWIGGFGNVAYIGWIPKELYENVTLPFEEVQAAVEGPKERAADGGFFQQAGL